MEPPSLWTYDDARFMNKEKLLSLIGWILCLTYAVFSPNILVVVLDLKIEWASSCSRAMIRGPQICKNWSKKCAPIQPII